MTPQGPVWDYTVITVRYEMTRIHMLMETGEHPTIARVGPPVDGPQCTDEVTGECRWTTEIWRRLGIGITEVWSPADLRPDVFQMIHN
ncbi:uncharacterized protein N7511_000176 [Penicillium nucicola]|uniref:uncharacterized protein n=1 Tax=Penicillium nucicola TaxID=1850975 RepID=UPI002544E22A|nr:uncharacterized protein N7511_000176 [Penicillium nucicola]KAJ5775165.1 hypothetical protein N7511_000176 [Penicillium nucicola]